MSVQVAVDPANTVGAAIAQAIADVDAANIRSEDRQTVLRAVLAVHLATASRVAPPEQVPAERPTPETQPGIELGGSDLLSKIAARMHVDRDLLELIYDVRDGEPEVVVSAKKLPEIRSAASKLLAQLLAGARQAAGLEEWTPVSVLRDLVQEYGRFDSNNFAAQMQQLDKVWLVRGKGLQREVKVTKPGMEEIASVIGQLAGG